MVILGLDPASKTGWSLSSGEHGLWLIAEKNDEHEGRKLERLRRLIYKTHQQNQITLIASEDAVMGTHFFKTQNFHTEIRGVIKLVAAELELPIIWVNPGTLKKWLTGHGKAEKHHMIDAIRTRFGITVSDDNIADAIAVMEYAKHQTQGEKEIQNELFSKEKTKKSRRPA